MRTLRLLSCAIFVCLLAFVLVPLPARAQTTAPDEWTWMGGSDTVVPPCPNNATVCSLSGVYGYMGTPDAGNYPGGRSYAATWTDSSGNLWLFGGGGTGIPNSGFDVIFDDLWEYTPSTNQWAWMGGRDQAGSNTGAGDPRGANGPNSYYGWPGEYGNFGKATTGNIPGSRYAAASWSDGSGNLWLFGGSGLDANNTWGLENDLWKFIPLTKTWAWMGGSKSVGSNCASSDHCGQSGVYGVRGTPDSGNVPGGRLFATSWTDQSGNFWLFGGQGIDSVGNWGLLNDLWEFNTSTNEWTWMGGNSTLGGNSVANWSGRAGVYGSLGVPAQANIPGGRNGATGWTDSGGNLWLLGGNGTNFILDDLWEYNTFTNEWTWMGGSNVGDQYGVYGTEGTFTSAHMPGSRDSASSWTDKDGKLWLFGGDGLASTGNGNELNDLWEFNPYTSEWAWMGGSNVIGNACAIVGYCGWPGDYGSKGSPVSANNPGSRSGNSTWTDSSGNFWLFGGDGFDINGTSGILYDLWVYQPAPSLPVAATPTISLPSGAYTTAQPVTIRDTTPNAVIYYTTNGTAPTVNSFVYGGLISVSSTETIEAIAVASGYANSSIATADYTFPSLAATNNTLTASATSLTAGQALTLTATVTDGGTGVAPGQVNFCDATAAYCTDIHLLGTAQLTSAGIATLKYIPAPGDHSYNAVFLGTTTDAGSSSNTVSVSVTGSGSAATTTTIAQSGTPGNYTLTATVTGQGTASPTGTVSFLDTSNANYVLGTAALGPVSGTNTLSFINSSSPATNQYPQSVAVGDFNGDGKLDMVVPDYSQPGINILLGNGDATFTAGPVAPTVSSNVNNAVVADFNGDGKADLALSLPDNFEIVVLLGNGDGSFNALTPIAAGTVWQIATGDFNGDGKADLVELNCGAQTLTIFLGNGDGTFTPVSPATSVPGCPTAVAVGDFNGDGKVDLAVSIDSSSTNLPGSVTVLLGDGDGSFTPTSQSLATGNSPLSIVAGDFRGNGVLDLAIANSYVDTFDPGTVTVLMGKGDGTFTPAAVSPVVGTMPYSVAVGDFNGDGKADLVTANVGDNTVTVLLGNGDGSFTTAATPASGSGTLFAATGDFNSDGLSDIAVADNNTAKVTILLAHLAGTGTATATVTGISPVGTGTHLVDASYPGDSNYSGSISATTPLTAEPAASSLVLSANPTSSAVGQQVLLTATLSPSLAQNHSPGGSVTFYNGATALGTGTVSNDVATLTTTALPTGNDSITAKYPGDTNFAAANSSALPFTVTQAALITTTTKLAAPPPTTTYGQSLTLTATVTPASGAAPTGTVTFLNGSTTLGNASLNGSGVAALQLTPPVGSYSITASYGGSATDASSVSSPSAILVNNVATTTILTASPNPAPFGASVTLTATVGIGSPSPIGYVSFYDGLTLLGTANLASGVALFPTSSLSVGSHNLTAAYAGGTGFNPSQSAIYVEVISPADFNIAASPASQTIYTGEAVSYTVTIAPGAGFNLPVALGCTQLPTNTTCSFAPATVPGGSTTSTLVVQTSAPHPAANASVLPVKLRITLLSGLLLLIIPRRQRGSRKMGALLLIFFALFTVGITGCGAPGPLAGATPTGSQSVVITATATNGLQTLTHTATVTLNVQSLF